MFKLISEQKKGSVMFKFIPFLIFVFLFGTSCESIKKKAVQSESAPASRSLAGLTKPSVGISGTQLNQLKRREREILSKLENKPLKVAYSFLVDEKTKRICYVESFKTKDIVPRFAKPASYEEARLFKKPPFPKCSGQEYSMISSYQNDSVLVDDFTEGVQVAGLPLLAAITIPVCGTISVKTLGKMVERADGIDNYMLRPTPELKKILPPLLAEDEILFNLALLYGFAFPAISLGIIFAPVIGLCVLGATYGHYVYHLMIAPQPNLNRIKVD